MNTRRNIFKSSIALAMSVAATSAMAQFGTSSDDTTAFVPLTDGTPILLRPGDHVTYDGHEYAIPGDLKFLESPAKGSSTTPTGQKIVTLGDGSGRRGVIVKRELWSFGLYPLTVYSVSGVVQRQSDGAFVGGTQSVTGPTLSANYSQLLDKGRRFEAGGFYFRDYQNTTDLYQVALRYFPTGQLGFQAAYLDSNKVNARSDSFHLLLQTQSRGPSGQGNALRMEFGVGILDTISPSYNVVDGSYDSSQTINFSTFLDVSYELTKNFKILATEWYVRVRNDDVNRFGLGFSYQF